MSIKTTTGMFCTCGGMRVYTMSRSGYLIFTCPVDSTKYRVMVAGKCEVCGEYVKRRMPGFRKLEGKIICKKCHLKSISDITEYFKKCKEMSEQVKKEEFYNPLIGGK